MIRSRFILSLVVLLPSIVSAAESPFTFPAIPVSPPPPLPSPSSVQVLTRGTLYVVNSKIDAVARAHPTGLVKITKETGPLKIRASFTDAPLKTETRTYTGPHVFLVEAVADGKVEIDFIPVKDKLTEADIEMVSLDVKTGVGPIPPPDPLVPPDPFVPQPVTSFRMFLVYKAGEPMPAAMHGAMFGEKVEIAMKEATAGDVNKFTWRRIDARSSPDTLPTGLKEVWTAAQPKITQTPCIVFQVNDKITLEPFPANETDTVALIKKYRGK